ncbi:MAG TPA: glycosyltransferase [Pirellulales bacterium]|nr:glycosyltransferase [Pirellulales bacterium]
MTMRILHVIPAVAPRYGGPSTAIWPMVGALRELDGLDVDVATTDADGPGGRLTEGDLPPTSKNIASGTVHLFRRTQGENLKYSRGLAEWLNGHAGDYDVIQTHSNWNHPVAAACRAARRAEVPYVIRPCGMLSSYTWRKSKWKKRAYWWLRERGNIRGAAGFHVTSEGERQEVLRLGVSAAVDVIPLGIGADAWETPVEPGWLREQCPQAGNRPIVLYLSRLHPKKGIVDLLLPALAQLKTDTFLVIVGGDDDHAPGYARQVKSEIGRLQLDGQVALLGPVPPSRRWAAFDGADLFVLSSHAENFGIVVAEAMARGKAVVVTTGVQFAEHVTASEAGSVIEPAASKLAASLDLWLAEPSRRTRAGECGRRYVQKHFTWRRIAEQLAELYRQVCRHKAV